MHNLDKLLTLLDWEKFEKKFVPWFFKNDPFWSKKVKQIWNWNDFPYKWTKKELGTDLVFIDNDDHYWAVQIKFYKKTTTINKPEVSSFLSHSNNKLISRRILFASTDKINSNALAEIKSQPDEVIKILYSDLKKSGLKYPSNPNGLNISHKAKKEPVEPFPWQKPIIKKVIKEFNTSSRGQLLLACGLGKTYISSWVSKELKSKCTLVLVPSLGLVSQAMSDWIRSNDQIQEVLCVCSDKTVSKKEKEDQFYSSVRDFSFPVSSDPKEISKFLIKKSNRVIFCTYQSSENILKAQQNIKHEFDLMVLDEAHKTVQSKKTLFNLCLDEKKIRSKKRLFATATPRYFAPHIKKQLRDKNKTADDMHDEKLYGGIFYTINFGEAIGRKLLNDYRVRIIYVKDSKIADKIKNRALIKLNNKAFTDATNFATMIGVLKSIKKAKIKRLISFHSRIKSAQTFSEELPIANMKLRKNMRLEENVYYKFIQGKNSADERRVILDELKELNNSSRAIISNARCLQEGIDVPSIDGIAFVDAKESKIDIVQAVGRAIRKTNDGKAANIILPLFTDKSGEINEKNFATVKNVIRALCDHDNLLADEIDNLRVSLGRKKGRINVKPKKIIYDFPSSIPKNFVHSLTSKIIKDVPRSSWSLWYGRLLAYKDKKKHVDVKNKEKFQGHALGGWVDKQRQYEDLYKKYYPERYNKLAKIGFKFNPKKEHRENELSVYEKHVIETKNAYVSKDLRVDELPIGGFIRQILKSWETLDKETKKRLNDLKEFGFDSGMYEDGKSWKGKYARLKEFFELKGHSCVTLADVREFKESKQGKIFIKSNKTKKRNKEWQREKILNIEKLYGWVLGQRGQKEKYMTDQRWKYKVLNDINFIWNTRDAQKERSFGLLSKFVKEYGHANPPTGLKQIKKEYKGKELKKMKTLRTIVNNYRTRPVKRDLRRRLNKIGFSFSLRDAKWLQNYELLKVYYKKHKKLPPESYTCPNTGIKLGVWVGRQADLIRKKEIKLDRKNNLYSITNNFNRLDY